MNRLIFEAEILRIREQIVPLERLIDLFSHSVDAPVLFSDETERGFRYNQPGLNHFCLLRMCRIVSALNASIELARLGYTQEIGVLLRTANEYSSHIEFALLGKDTTNVHNDDAIKFVSSYFNDSGLASPNDKKRFVISQKAIHDALGASLDATNAESSESKSTSDLMSRVYVMLSGYVHGAYKSIMDLFGGRPGRFHLRGMSGTPKDSENIAVLDTLIVSASLCFIAVVQKLALHRLVAADELLSDWYKSAMD
jgi:hypothetical protein